MVPLAIPAGFDEITPAWLTEALHSGGTASSGSVISIDAGAVGEDKGFMSQVVRLTLEYDMYQDDLPRTLIAKLPSTDPTIKALANVLGGYRREVRFYEEIATRVGIRTPDRYYSATDPQTGRTVLLLQDLSQTRLGDSLAGCSLDEARLVIRLLARVHASWWDSLRLGRLNWMPLKSADAGLYQRIYSRSWPIFVEKAGKGMPDSLLRIGESLGPHIPQIRDRLGDRPHTIVHGDYRLDNLFFDAPDGDRPLVVFDWEFCSRGRGTYDVATFISESFPPEVRRKEEMDLLRMYHALLKEGGVGDYSFDQCLRDYRLSMLDIFLFWIVVGGYCDYEGERATMYLHNSLERFDAAIADLRSVELLSE